MTTTLPLARPAALGFDGERLARIDRFLAERYILYTEARGRLWQDVYMSTQRVFLGVTLGVAGTYDQVDPQVNITDIPIVFTLVVGLVIAFKKTISVPLIVRARRLAKATLRNIRQNLVFAFVYNVLGVPIAAGILYPFFGLRILSWSQRFC